MSIKNLHASVDGKKILNGVSFDVLSGEVHAIMGPNGSGKSTLAYVLMGSPSYECQMSNAQCTIDAIDILSMRPDQRAKAGLFLAFQSPIPIPGVSVFNLLRTAYQEIHKVAETVTDEKQNPVLSRRWQAEGMSLQEFTKQLKEYAKLLHIDEAFLSRGIHDGFSGGEKKKLEMLQALVLAPKFAIFDEIDTGLDVDALKIVAAGIEQLKKQGTGIIVITHYQRILKYVKPDVVHVFVKGKIVQTGTASLSKTIEAEGYGQYTDKK